MPVVNLLPFIRSQFFDANGNPLAGGTVGTFVAGTTTPQATYTDSTGATPNSNPVVLDSSGTAAIWLIQNAAYKFVIKNSGGVVIETIDNVLAPSTGSTSIGPQSQVFITAGTFTIPTGVSSVKVTVVAGGGAGGGASTTQGGGSGGAGGAGIKWLTGLVPGNTLAVVVGAGGTAVSGAGGNNGVASSVASGTQAITSILTNPGSGGSGPAAISGAGIGGSGGSGGDLNFGGGSGNIQFGTNGVGVPGGNSIFGGGGKYTFGATGVAGSAPGAGGGGAGPAGGGPFAGGAGAPGIVIFEWVG
jgi:hypothetical protein